MNGNIFLSGRYYLSLFHMWTTHAKPEEAYVHSETVDDILAKANRENWQSKPTHYIPASWDGHNVTITGKKTRIE